MDSGTQGLHLWDPSGQPWQCSLRGMLPPRRAPPQARTDKSQTTSARATPSSVFTDDAHGALCLFRTLLAMRTHHCAARARPPDLIALRKIVASLFQPREHTVM